ncbi:DJ-1/PfpI family protein [Burkholderia sp. MR1-5-21]
MMQGNVWRILIGAVVALSAWCAGAAWPAAGMAAPAGDPSQHVARPLSIAAPKDGRPRPLVAIVADNAGTETTDLIVPFAILKTSGAADVVTVSSGTGLVELMPALRMRADTTFERFDAATPAGADVVIVPALHRADQPVVLAWLRKQAAAGAVTVAICDGAEVLANAGLLANRMATSHWYSRNALRRRFPDTVWIGDRRYVEDGDVMTTSGVSASIPASLTLVERLAGPEVARVTAARLGIATWSDVHDSSAFRLSARVVATALGNRVAFWRHETFDLPLDDGFDELPVALAADAWARTSLAEVVATHASGEVVSRHGLRLVTQKADGPHHARLPIHDACDGCATPSAVLSDIASRYGDATADFVALQLEYARTRPGADRASR